MQIKERVQIERRWNQMRNEEQSWVTPWKDIRRFLCPTRGFFYDSIPNWGLAFDYKSQLTSRPRRALRTMASGMTSGLTSPSRPWFKLGLSDEEMMDSEPVKEWIGDVEKIIFSILAKSNIYSGLHNCYEEIGGFGTAALMILEDNKNVVRCRPFTIGEYYLGQSETGVIDSFGRNFWMTVAQLVEEFGIDNVCPSTANMFKNGNVDQWIKVSHVIEPNNDRIQDKSDFLNMPYRSVVWEQGSPVNWALRIGGYESFPVLAPRWDTTTNSHIYGWGLGHNVLGDLRELMKKHSDRNMALAKVIDPPLQKDGTVQGEVNTLPGGITSRSGSTPDAGVRATYQVNPDLQAIDASIEQIQQEIEKMFYVDLFLMLTDIEGGKMTAHEVVERHEEKLLALGPVLERLQNELLDPLISRVFEICMRSGVLPPPPQELQGQELKIEYISILAQAQKMVGTATIEQTLAFAGNLIGVFPEARDAINPDEAIIQYSQMMGTPAKIIRTSDQIAAVRQQRMQAEEAQRSAAAIPVAADTAKTLSETPVGNSNALEAMLGNKTPVPANPTGA